MVLALLLPTAATWQLGLDIGNVHFFCFTSVLDLTGTALLIALNCVRTYVPQFNFNNLLVYTGMKIFTDSTSLDLLVSS